MSDEDEIQLDEEDELLSINSNDSDDEVTIVEGTKSASVGKRQASENNVKVKASKSSTGGSSNSKGPLEEITLSDDESNDSGDRRSTSQGENSSGNETEIILSDDDDDDTTGENANDSGNGTSPIAGSSSNSGYTLRLRNKGKINYAEVDAGLGLEEGERPAKRKNKEDLDVFALTPSRISRITQDPSLIDSYTKCKISFQDGTDSSKLKQVTKLFSKCGDQFDYIFVSTRNSEDVFPFFQGILKTTVTLSRLDYRYHDRENAFEFLKMVDKLRKTEHLPALTSLKLISICGMESLTERHIELIANMPIKLYSLEIGDALWEDVKPETLEKLLKNQHSSLETLIVQGGFRGNSEKEKLLITFPKMENLKTIYFCPVYDFVSEIKNPHSDRQKVVTVGKRQEEPFKIALRFPPDHVPKLERLVLGNLIDIEDLLFSTLRKLTEFRCGSYWNLSVTFPSGNARNTLLKSSITGLQLPDCLKDPTFPVKLAEHFPNVKKIWLYLPSVPVLRSFFKAFENSGVEYLHLKTQFDFESTMESCLLPLMSDVLCRNSQTESILETLKEYKHFDEYVKYYNVELPVEQEDLMEGHSAGITALKKLKALHLEHVPRKLLIPVPDDERKWYDHNCKFMSTTFGYIHYPLTRKCINEIMKMKLEECSWKNIDIKSEQEFHQAGFNEFIPLTDEDMFEEDEVDIFLPVQRKKMGTGTHVKIMPSMLAPAFKAKFEERQND